MKNSILLALLCLCAVFAVACGGGNNAATNGGNTASGGGGEAAGDDYWDRYVSTYKKGRTWTHKTDAAGNISYSKSEVLDVVEGDKAVVQMTTLDKDKKPFAGVDPMKMDVSIKKVEAPATNGTAAPAPKWEEKKIKVEAGEFDCVSMDGKNWMMKKHPGIIVKSEMQELVEFKE